MGLYPVPVPNSGHAAVRRVGELSCMVRKSSGILTKIPAVVLQQVLVQSLLYIETVHEGLFILTSYHGVGVF